MACDAYKAALPARIAAFEAQLGISRSIISADAALARMHELAKSAPATEGVASAAMPPAHPQPPVGEAPLRKRRRCPDDNAIRPGARVEVSFEHDGVVQLFAGTVHSVDDYGMVRIEYDDDDRRSPPVRSSLVRPERV